MGGRNQEIIGQAIGGVDYDTPEWSAKRTDQAGASTDGEHILAIGLYRKSGANWIPWDGTVASAAPADAPFLTFGQSTGLSNEFSVKSSDRTLLLDGQDVHFEWQDDTAARSFIIQNVDSTESGETAKYVTVSGGFGDEVIFESYRGSILAANLRAQLTYSQLGFGAGSGIDALIRRAAAGTLEVQRTGTGVLLQGALVGEANPRWRLQENLLEFGPGSTAPDVLLRRPSLGLLEVQRAAATASSGMLRGLIGVEANPRWQFGFSSGSLLELGFGAGGATAMTEFLRRTATRALRLVSTTGTTFVTLGALSSTDTQPRWLLTTRALPSTLGTMGAWSAGPGGSTAVDTHIHRGPDAAQLWVRNYLALPNLLTAPSPTDPQEAESPLYLYARPPGGVSGLEARLFYRSLSSGVAATEIGPLGFLRGLLRRFNLALGGMEINNADNFSGLSGVDFWGLLAAPTASANSSADAAYSPALSLTGSLQAPGTTDSGTANAAVTTTATTLTDTREAWATNEWAGAKLVYNATLTGTVVSNTATTLTISVWSTPGDPVDGQAWSLLNGATTFAVTGGLPLIGDMIVIDTEKIQVISTSSPNVIGCYRGVAGTTAAAHLAGAAISLAAGSTRTMWSSDGEPTLELDTGTTINSDASLEFPFGPDYHTDHLLVWKLHLRNVTDIRLFAGFTDQTAATMLASDNPAGNYFGIQFSTARGDPRIQCVSKDGTTQNLQNTDWTSGLGETPFVGEKYYVVMEFVSGSSPTISLFNASWVQVGTTETLAVNLPIPDTVRSRLVVGIRNTAAASKRIRHHMASYNISPSVA